MFVLKSKKSAPKVDTAPFVEIEGVTYDVPVRIPASWALKFIAVQAESGTDASTIWLLEKCLGAAGYTALMNFDQLDPADLNGIVVELRTRVIGALDESGKDSTSG